MEEGFKEDTGDKEDMGWCGGDKELAELILEDKRLYEEVIGSYDFKTEEVRINLAAAVRNFNRVTDIVDKKELSDNPRLHRAVPANVDYDKLGPYFLYRPKRVIKKTLENTTQMAKATINSPLRKHLKSRFLMLRHPRLNEVVATDTYFSDVKSIEGYNCAQVFVGLTSRRITTIGMNTKGDFPEAYQDFMRRRGIPHTLRRDNAKEETSEEVQKLHRDYVVADEFTEPHSPWQNPAEGGGVRFLKAHAEVLMNRSGAPDYLWFLCHEYICAVHECCANEHINWETPLQKSGEGTPDISHIMQFRWYEPVYYYNPNTSHPKTKEEPGYFVGFGENVGDALTFKILTLDTRRIIHRSVVRSALDPKAPNKRVKWDKPLPPLEAQDQHKHPASKVIDLEEADNVNWPSKLNFVDELEEVEPVARRTRSHKEASDGPGSKVLANMIAVDKSQISTSDAFKTLMLAGSAVMCFILNAPVLMNPPSRSLNGLEISEEIPDLGTEETQRMTDAMRNMTKNDFERLKYVQAVDKINEEHDEDYKWDMELWDVKTVHRHKGRIDNIQVLCEFKDPNKSKAWVSLFALALQDPIPILHYIKRNHLFGQNPFRLLVNYCTGDATSHLVRAFKAKVKPGGPKFKFGVQVPMGVKQALALDRKNGNTKWQDAIKKELAQLEEFMVFRCLAPGEKLPEGYKQIPYHIVFDVKFDLRAKARLVADGNWTDLVREDIYSGVVGMETVRMGFTLGELNGLKCCAGDVGNAFLNGYTREKIFIIAGPEFGPELEGKILIVVRSLYGLRTSAARFHEHLTDNLRQMGFAPSKADPNMFYRDKGDHYEYLASYVDDILIWSRDPMSVMEKLMAKYTMKGVGIPEYYLGGNVEQLDEHWSKENIFVGLSARTYIENVIPKFEELLDMEFKKYKTPMEEKCHPELDDSPLCDSERASIFRSIIGSLNWIITLGRFDINYATMSLARFNMAPREGHFKAALRIMGYLKAFQKGTILLDNSYPDHSSYTTDVEQDWQEFYPDAEEDIPHDMLKPKGKKARLTVFVDADHAHDQVTRRSVTGIVVMLNNTPIRWVSKRQKTVESSTYGSELVAARIATELILELRYTLRMLGVPLDGPALMLGDNMSVVLNTTVPSSVLKKKHLGIGYHRVREAIAAKVMRFAHIPSEDNLADIMTKPLPSATFYKLVKPVLFRVPAHVREQDMVLKGLQVDKN